MLIGLFMSQLLNHGAYLDEIRRERILAKLGPELTADLYPTTSWRDRPPGSRPGISEPPAEKSASTGGDGTRSTPPSRAALSERGTIEVSLEEQPVFGSNNWVISDAHTVTGQPLLSNDMHLPHQIPNTWYEAHLEVRDPQPPQDPRNQNEYELARRYNVAGFTLPGIPFVIVGHNPHLAWGFTNLGPDVADVYIETFNEQGEYLTPQGWKKPEIRQERIRVGGGSDVPAGVVVTRHGPIITSLVPGETRQLALKWGAITEPAFTGVPFLEVNAARNWEEFRRAFSRFGGPAQNVVYTDVDGHIGYQATGRIPVRASGDGSLPMPGHTDAYEWIGVVPFDKLPSVFDPPSGILATANNRITPDGYPHALATQWFPPYRAERIYRVLESERKFAAADMLALQMDVHSEFDRFLAEQFVAAIERAKNPSQRARAAANLMRAWDGRLTPDSSAATLVVHSRTSLFRLLLEPKLGADYKLYRWGLQSVALENIVRQRPARWLPEKYANYEELLAAAVEAAVSDSGAPRDLASWRWGKFLALQLQHPLFGSVPVLRGWTGPTAVEQSGGSYTVKQTSRISGVSERMTVDFADLDASTFNILTGQSGQIFSPYYMDHFPAWHEGRSFAMPFTPAAVEKARAHELILQPAK
jgi:penicillin amidase